MTFQRYRGHRRPIGYLMSMASTKAELITVGECLMSMVDMKTTLTARAVYLINMVNIKVGLKNDKPKRELQ